MRYESNRSPENNTTKTMSVTSVYCSDTKLVRNAKREETKKGYAAKRTSLISTTSLGNGSNDKDVKVGNMTDGKLGRHSTYSRLHVIHASAYGHHALWRRYSDHMCRLLLLLPRCMRHGRRKSLVIYDDTKRVPLRLGDRTSVRGH